LPGNQILLGNRRVVGVDWGGWRTEHPDLQRSLMDELLALAAAGKLHPREPASYPLASAAQALDDVNQRRIIGKVVLHP
jgi:NADPH2:quinone reductase